MPENDEDTQEQQNLFNQIENKVVAKILYYFKSIITLNEQKVNEINRAAYESDNTPKDISWPGNYKKYIDAIIQLFSLTKSDESKLQQKFGVPTSNEPTGSYQIYHQVSSGAPKHPELFDQIENKPLAKILSNVNPPITLNQKQVEAINQAGYNNDKTPRDISSQENYKSYVTDIIKVIYPNQNTANIQKIMLSQELQSFKASFPIMQAASQPKQASDKMNVEPSPGGLFNQIENKPLAKILSNFNPPITLNQKQVEAINQAGYNNDKTPRDISSQENYKSYVTDIIKVIYPNQNTANIQKIMLSQELQSFKASFPIMQAASQPKQASDKTNVEPSPGGLFNQIENKPLAKILSSLNPPVTLNEQQVNNINMITKDSKNITTTDGFRKYLDQVRKEGFMSKTVDEFHKEFGLDSGEPGMSRQQTAIIFENFRIQKEQNSSGVGNQPLTLANKKIDPEEPTSDSDNRPTTRM